MASNNDNQAGVMLYSLGGALLISLVTEVITATHYWRMLSGVPLIAIGGLAFVAWTQLWATAWAVWEKQDRLVKRIAYGASLFVTLVMIVNAGFVLSTRGHENKDEVKTRQERVEVEELRGLDPGVAKELLRQKAEERKQKAEEERRERILNEGGRRETTLADIRDGYMDFWIYVLPFAVAALAKFCVLAAIALPGGASSYLPGRQSSPAPAPEPRPEPKPEPRPSSPEPAPGSKLPPSVLEKIKERINGGSGRKN